MAGTRGRKPGFHMSEEHRVKIKNSNILNALIEHVDGKREMSGSQVTAGLGLLKKVMPDLSAMELDHGVQQDNPLASMLQQIAENGKRVGDSKG